MWTWPLLCSPDVQGAEVGWLFEERTMFFLRPELLWHFAYLLDIVNTSDQIQEALPTAAEVRTLGT